MNKISDTILHEILQRCDITEIISGYIPLKKAGRNFKALCPFHHEKTPSFIVSPDKQIFHCFGCGAGGDVFSFIMKHERMEFPEAVRYLAEKTGVKITWDPRKQSAEKASAITLLYKINEAAAWYFCQCLSKNPPAQEYLSKRGIPRESIDTFRIGFAPERWDGLLRFLRAKGLSAALLLKSGLVVEGARGKIYDRFRNRIMFPIFNAQGKIIGFGGRTLNRSKTDKANGDDNRPKYVNSPETHVYVKSKNLYGLNLSKRYIQEEGSCVIVEGYFDFISPFQAGIKNIVASLGTAFTIDHVRLLKRYTTNVTIVFDADEAGQEATLRSLDLLIEEGMTVRIAVLDAGYDPDTYVQRYGEKKFRETIKEAKSLFDYKLNLLTSQFRKDVPEEKAQIASSMLEMISLIKNAILRATYIKKLSEILSVREEELLIELKKVKSSPGIPATHGRTGDERTYKVAKVAEKMLMSLMFDDFKLVKQLKKVIDYNEFSDPVAQKIAKHLFNNVTEEDKPAAVLARLADQEVNSFMCNLLLTDLGIRDRQKSVTDCIRKIKKDKIQLRLNELHHRIRAAQQGDEKELKILLKEYHDLKKEQSVYEKGNKKKEI